MGGNNVDLAAESKVTPQAANQLQALNEAATEGSEGTDQGGPAAGEEADPASWATLGANVNAKLEGQPGEGDDDNERGDTDEDDAGDDEEDDEDGTDDGEGPGDEEDDGVRAPSAEDQAVAEAAGESHDDEDAEE